jgi:hypothetical protein
LAGSSLQPFFTQTTCAFFGFLANHSETNGFDFLSHNVYYVNFKKCGVVRTYVFWNRLPLRLVQYVVGLPAIPPDLSIQVIAFASMGMNDSHACPAPFCNAGTIALCRAGGWCRRRLRFGDNASILGMLSWYVAAHVRSFFDGADQG